MMRLDQNGSSHLTLQLANALRSRVLTGGYAAGQQIPSERELCKASGTSRTTVRRAIELLVDEGLLRRVPGSGTFVGHRSPASQQATFGLTVPTMANPFYAELLHVVEQEASAKGYYVLVGQSDYSPTREAAYMLDYAHNPAIRGIMTVPNVEGLPVEAYGQVGTSGIPLVFVGRQAHFAAADSVATGHAHGCLEAVRYLIGLGHRRIAYIQGMPHMPTSRLQGYLQALREASIPEDGDLILSLKMGAAEAGVAGARELLHRRTPFTAICARNDVTAVNAVRVLNGAGLRVPADVSVVGFDNTELSRHLQPTLTTVDHTLHEIGRLAVLFLEDRIEGRYRGPGRQVTIQPRLVIRESCSSPSGGAAACLSGSRDGAADTLERR